MSKTPYEHDPATPMTGEATVDHMPNLPILPYDGTSGHSGTDTSRERAVTEDQTGVTAQRQAHVLDMLQRNPEGLTVQAVRHHTGWHHGQASAALSNLHKAGKIAMLEEKRNRCHVYSDWAFVGDRTTLSHSSQRKAPEPVVDEQKVRAAISNAYYEARNNGLTMENAADAATKAVMRMIAGGA